MRIFRNSVGRKIVMALTGQLMVFFAIAHVLGNSTLFFGTINAYAAGLHALPPLLWAFRSALTAALALHVYFGIQLSLENSDARPQEYVRKAPLASTFAGRNMIWTGSVIGVFLIYHLLHFTFQVIDPATAAATHVDSLGRPDVLSMVIAAFRKGAMVALYGAGLAGLWLHLSHGIQSSFQTWGLNGERSFPFVQRGGSFAAIALLLAYAAIPAAIFAGFLLR
jgi:succinate dehydrogenase / fumarate reductase cytochrome b subunit